MNIVRAGQPGATRVCPHCKATVLESATICPGCRHHLRFSGNGGPSAAESYCAFSVDGTIAHKLAAQPCEYSIVLAITNERGEQIVRQVVGVGALQPGELRRMNLSVEMLPLVVQRLPERETAAAQPVPARAAQPTARPGLAAAPASSAGSAATTGVRAPTPSAAPASVPAAPAASRTATTAKPAVKAPPTRTAGPTPGSGPGVPAAQSPATAGPAATATVVDPKLPAPAPGATLSQRLRIFRKP